MSWAGVKTYLGRLGRRLLSGLLARAAEEAVRPAVAQAVGLAFAEAEKLAARTLTDVDDRLVRQVRGLFAAEGIDGLIADEVVRRVREQIG